MGIEQIEELKRDYTDTYVAVDASRPELARFKNITGQVMTVNMSGRALVQFDAWANIGWYDIDVDYLKVVPKPEPKEPAAKAKPKKPAAKKPAAKAEGGKKLSPLALARMQGGGQQGGAGGQPTALRRRCRGARPAPAPRTSGLGLRKRDRVSGGSADPGGHRCRRDPAVLRLRRDLPHPSS